MSNTRYIRSPPPYAEILFYINIQHIVTMSHFIHVAIDIHRVYSADIFLFTQFSVLGKKTLSPLTNKEASTVLCPVVNHAGSSRGRKKCRGKHETQSSVLPDLKLTRAKLSLSRALLSTSKFAPQLVVFKPI